MSRPVPSLLDLDILRATLGPALVAPYDGALGGAPWLTAGTLTWAAADAAAVVAAWRAWTARLPVSALTAVRRSGHVAAVDVAFVGDPWGAAARLALLRRLEPRADTVGIAAPGLLLGRRGGAPARVVAMATPVAELPAPDALLAAPVPDGICVGARHTAAGAALIAVGVEADVPRLGATLDDLRVSLRRVRPFS
jgi:hypothetical protein